MRTSFLCCIIIFVSLSAFSQQWESASQLTGENVEPRNLVLDRNNNSYVLATFRGIVNTPIPYTSNGTPRDILLIKYNPIGQIVWARHIGSSSADLAGGLTLSENGNLFVGVNFSANITIHPNDTVINITSGQDFLVAVFDTLGNFDKIFCTGNGLNTQGLQSVTIDRDGNVIMAGYFTSTMILNGNQANDTTLNSATAFQTPFIAKYSAGGILVWSTKFASANNDSKIVKISNSDNGYYFGGYYKGALDFGINRITSMGDYDNFIIKTDFQGNINWIRSIQGAGIENFTSIKTDEFDNIYMLGNYTSNSLIDSSVTSPSKIVLVGNSGGKDTYIVKYNRSGTFQWIVSKGSAATDVYRDFSIKNNIIYAVGSYSDTIVFNTDTLMAGETDLGDGFLAAFNEIGDPIAGIEINGGDNTEGISYVETDFSSKAYVVGFFRSSTITIGSNTFINTNPGELNNDIFFARYSHPFKAVITDEEMVKCYGGNDGMLTATPYFGQPPYTFAWSHNAGAMDSVVTGLSAGTYTVTITDALSQTAWVSKTITQPATPLSLGFSHVDVTCFGGLNGSVNLSASGGTSPYTYGWAGGTGVNPVTEDQINISAGTYYVTVTDANGCQESGSRIVGQPLQITFGGTMVSTDMDDGAPFEGGVDLSLSGGTPGYTYLWSPGGQTTQDLTAVAKGAYTVTATDSRGCSNDTTVVVPGNNQLLASLVSKSDVTCTGDANGSATVSVSLGSGSYQYSWTKGGFPIGGNSPSISGQSGGTYIVNVVDVLQPAKSGSTTVHIGEAASNLSVQAFAANPLCYSDATGIINLVVSGGQSGFTYSWSNGATTEDQVFLVASATPYAVTVTDAYGCQDFASATISQPDSLAITFNLTWPRCKDMLDGLIEAVATGGTGNPTIDFSYLWSDGGNQSTATAFDLRGGNYTVTVTDLNGCEVVASTSLPNPTDVKIDSVVFSNSVCFAQPDGEIRVYASGGSGNYDYTWAHTGNNTAVLTGLHGGTYYVTVDDVNNCTPVLTNTTLSEPALFAASFLTDSVSCAGRNDGAIDLSVAGGSGAFDYTWAHTPANTPTLTNLLAGTYDVTVSDGLCPDFTFSIPVYEPLPFTAASVVDHVSCAGLTDGSITINSSGGSGVYSYTWSPAAGNTNTLTNLTSGSYNVTVSDGRCPNRILNGIAVNSPDGLVIDSVVVQHQQVLGENDGRITIYAKGGTPLLIYQLNNLLPQYSQLFTNLAPGKYKPFVDDANGCGPISTDSITVNGYISGSYEVGQQNRLQIFPNPASEMVTVISDMPLGSVTIIGANGQKVFSQPSGIEKIRELRIDIRSFAPGIYILLSEGIGQQRFVVE